VTTAAGGTAQPQPPTGAQHFERMPDLDGSPAVVEPPFPAPRAATQAKHGAEPGQRQQSCTAGHERRCRAGEQAGAATDAAGGTIEDRDASG